MASGAAIDARDNSGDTALMYHAFLPKVVGALLAAGADPTPANNRGQTAVMLARQFSCESCAITLEQAAAKRRGVNGKAGQSR
jgi:ankyrin repeat protein